MPCRSGRIGGYLFSSSGFPGERTRNEWVRTAGRRIAGTRRGGDEGRSEIGPEQLFRLAAERLGARDVAGADELLKAALDQKPDHFASLRLSGLIAGRAGHDEKCIAFLERAFDAGREPEKEAVGNMLALAHKRAGRMAAAEGTYRDVLALFPQSAEALLNLGLLLQASDRHEEAVVDLRRASGSEPGLAVAHAALAVSLRALGRLEAASASAEEALALSPRETNFAGNLATIRNAQARYVEAEALCRAALEVGDDAGILNTLGVSLRQQGLTEEAATCFERATRLRPDHIDALYNLATARKDAGDTDEAIALFRRVVALAPRLAAARFALCMAHLPSCYASQDELERRRSGYAQEIDMLAAFADEHGAKALAPGVGAAQPFLLPAQGDIDTDLQRRYGAIVCRAMAEAYAAAPLAEAPQPGERIRVGIVCGFIRDHSVWRMPTRAWVAGLDRSRFEVIGYHTGTERDAETKSARSLFDRFVQEPSSIEGWRGRIVADCPHALIYPEIGMDPTAARLAAMRLARVQYASWGHPSTSGYPTIDIFLSSEEMEPEGGDQHYTERLVRLAGLSTSFAMPTITGPLPTRPSLGLPEDATVYWSGQSLHKYLPKHDGVFAEIAHGVPDACFVFIASSDAPALTHRLRDRLSAAFALRGLDAEGRCLFLPRMTPNAFRTAVGVADVVLDSIGWSGCNTLIDALAHRRPIVTLTGVTMRSRHGTALLRKIGWDRLVCRDLAEYVTRAIELGRDPAMREACRAAVTDAALALMDDEPATDLGRCIENEVRRCTGERGSHRRHRLSNGVERQHRGDA